MSQDTPWWDRAAHADRKPFLQARGTITAAVRRWFEAQGFVEVDTGCLVVSPGNEAHLSAFKTELVRTRPRRHAPLPAHLARVCR